MLHNADQSSNSKYSKNSRLQNALMKQRMENMKAKRDPTYVAKDHISGIQLARPKAEGKKRKREEREAKTFGFATW